MSLRKAFFRARRPHRYLRSASLRPRLLELGLQSADILTPGRSILCLGVQLGNQTLHAFRELAISLVAMTMRNPQLRDLDARLL